MLPAAPTQSRLNDIALKLILVGAARQCRGATNWRALLIEPFCIVRQGAAQHFL